MTELSPKPVTLILVPGAGGQAWYWHRVAAELEARGHTAVAVDLPAGDDNADLGVYVDTIVDAAIGRDRVVLVAQSMGGFAAPLACDRLSVAACAGQRDDSSAWGDRGPVVGGDRTGAGGQEVRGRTGPNVHG